MPQFSDDIYLGPAVGPIPIPSNPSAPDPSPMTMGVGPLGRLFLFDIVPVALSLSSIVNAQTSAGAGALTLNAAGTGVTPFTNDATNALQINLDVARAVSLQSTGNLSAVNFTIVGKDRYGQIITQVIAGPNNNTVTTGKTFKTIISVTVSAAVGTAVNVGHADVFGFPFAVTDVGYAPAPFWNGAAGGTVTAAVTTDPSTTALGDVRGKYAPASAADGVKRLVLPIYLPAIAVGPNATRKGAFGVTQV